MPQQVLETAQRTLALMRQSEHTMHRLLLQMDLDSPHRVSLLKQVARGRELQRRARAAYRRLQHLVAGQGDLFDTLDRLGEIMVLTEGMAWVADEAQAAA